MTLSMPLGIRLLPSIPVADRNVAYRVFILIFTFLCYTSYHLSRKPISVVKSVLHRNCSVGLTDSSIINSNVLPNDTSCNWKPFEGSDYSSLFGSLDSAYLFSYAAGMFLSGHIAERMNLRHFLSLGMVCSGIMTICFGLGYFLEIHSLAFYILVQVIGGLVQSTGWPSVVTCMGNWYGKGKRGLIMGIWNSHTSVGNILGSLIAGAFVNHAWGWSFVVPGIIIGSLGIICFFVLVPNPEDVDCSLPDHEAKSFISKKEADIEKAQKPDSTDESSNVEYGSKASEASLVPHKPTPSENPPISIWRALRVPGVVEFSLCLFFAKLVSYTFLFWLPKYLSATIHIDAEKAADLSTLFDVGGIMGGILAGLVSDYTGARATTCVVMLIIAAPVMYIYNLYGGVSLTYSIVLSLITGALVNGPYALITTAVSADLGTHKSLQGNAKALATVTAIIDGTGSIGSAVGPLLAGVIETHGTWNDVFWMLIASDLAAFVVSVLIALRREWYSYLPNMQQLPWVTQFLQLRWVNQLPQLKATNLSYILTKTTLVVAGSATAFVIFFVLGYSYGFENIL